MDVVQPEGYLADCFPQFSYELWSWKIVSLETWWDLYILDLWNFQPSELWQGAGVDMPGRNPKTPWRATERTGPKCVAFSFVSSAEFLCHEWWMTWINIHCNILCGSVSAIIPDMDQYILLYQDIQADNYWFGWRVDGSIDWWIECSVAGLMCWRTDLMWGLIERTQTVPCIFAIQRAGDERERERIICCLSYVLVFFLFVRFFLIL